MKPLDFKNQFGPWALVAGASRGLGAEYARQLAEKGLNLVLVSRQLVRLLPLATGLHDSYGIEVCVLGLDLADPVSAERIVELTADLEIGLLVYNAAYAPVSPFFTSSLDDHLKMLEINVRTPLSLVYRLGQAMRARRRGGVVLMSSLSATQGSAWISDYAATKAYNLTLAEGLWDELRRDGIAVIASLPASIATPNYLESLPEGKQSPAQALLPEQVVRETLAALGKQSVVVPGWNYRLTALILRLLPRQWVVRLMGRVLNSMYSKQTG